MPAIAGQTWLDEMLYGDNATEEVAQARTDKFVLKYYNLFSVVWHILWLHPVLHKCLWCLSK